MGENLVQLTDDHFIADMMYARSNNMIGRAVYTEIGYGNKICIHRDVRDALLRLIPFLEEHHFKMRICDAYRPPIAHQKMLEIIPFEGFFAATPEYSNHCHGTAVDVCLTDINGDNLCYPTEIDAYEKRFQEQVCAGKYEEFQLFLLKARHDYTKVSFEALQNRQQLKILMESVGFESIPHEWWHYNIKNWQSYPIINWSPQ